MILNGFMADHEWIEPIDEYLKEQGYPTYSLDIATTGPHAAGHKKWIRYAQDELTKLGKKYRDIVLIGFSMGGLLGLNLALKNNIKAVITIGTPIYCLDFNAILKNVKPVKTLSVNMSQVRRYLYWALNIPARPLLSLLSLINTTKQHVLQKVTAPALIIHGQRDDIARCASADYIYNSIRSRVKYRRYYEKSSHNIFAEEEKDIMFNEIHTFIQSVENIQ